VNDRMVIQGSEKIPGSFVKWINPSTAMLHMIILIKKM
jgi:hypothetical protein